VKVYSCGEGVHGWEEEGRAWKGGGAYYREGVHKGWKDAHGMDGVRMGEGRVHKGWGRACL
jgi:hypothetical protein